MASAAGAGPLIFPGIDRVKKPINNSYGFTLLELILSLVIIGFIVGISLGAIRLGIATQEAGSKRAETFQRLRIIGEHLSEKIKSSYPVFVRPEQDELAKKPPTSIDRILAFEGRKDSIRLVTFASPLSAPEDRIWAHEVKFYLGKHPKTEETGIIMMEKDISDGDIFTNLQDNEKEGRYFLLAKDVSHLEFRYYLETEEPKKEPGSTKEELVRTGKWVSEIIFDPPVELESSIGSADVLLSEKEALLSLPKGVEISLGLYEPADSEKDEEPKLVSSPPIHLLFHSGMEFKLPEKTIEDEDPIGGRNAAT